MQFKSPEEQWKYYGKQMGYKSCCIDAFLKGEQVHDSIFSGTGFLPCKECAKLEPKIVLKYIEEHRVEDSTFPYDYPLENYSKRYRVFIDKLMKEIRDE